MKKQCEICKKEKEDVTRELMLGPRGFRLHETCKACYATYKAGGKAPKFEAAKIEPENILARTN